MRRVPAADLSGKLVGTKVRLANGSAIWALIGNISPRNKEMTEQYLSLSLERRGQWFHLARYFDPEYERLGPHALSEFLELGVKDIFPIAYDLRPFGKGDSRVLEGAVPEEPPKRLGNQERMNLLFEGSKHGFRGRKHVDDVNDS